MKRPPSSVRDDRAPLGFFVGRASLKVMARVLVIDDRDCDRESVMALLRLHGHEVCAAADARQGLDMVAENPPEVILLDMLMPRFDGWYFLEAREPDPRLRDIPC